MPHICRELAGLFEHSEEILELQERIITKGSDDRDAAYSRLCARLESGRRQQELLYTDRLEGRISEQLFERMNLQMEKRLGILERELDELKARNTPSKDLMTLAKAAAAMLAGCELTHEMAETAVSRITVFEEAVAVDLKY